MRIAYSDNHSHNHIDPYPQRTDERYYACVRPELAPPRRGVQVIIPMKNLTHAKSRLAEQLSLAERRTLAIYMYRRVLQVVCAALPPSDAAPEEIANATIQQVWVVSDDPLILDMARAAGAQPILDTASDLNAALQLGLAAAQQDAAQAVLVIAADIPLISLNDVRGLAAVLRPVSDHPFTAEPRAVIAPDRAQSGTNAFGFTLPPGLPFHFGNDSFALHLQAAHERGIPIQTCQSATLALDVDTPADLTYAWHPDMPVKGA